MADSPLDPTAGDQCSCSALRQAARHVTRLYDEALAPFGLGLNQYAILAKLDRAGPSSVTDLAAHLVMDRSTLGHLLRRLEARRLLRLDTAAGDRRQRLITMTEAGAALLAAAKPVWRQTQQRFEDAFGVRDTLDLREILHRAARVSLSAPGAPPSQPVSPPRSFPCPSPASTSPPASPPPTAAPSATSSTTP